MNAQSRQNIQIRSAIDLITISQNDEKMITDTSDNEKTFFEKCLDSRLSEVVENVVLMRLNFYKNHGDEFQHRLENIDLKCENQNNDQFEFVRSLSSQEAHHLLEIFVEVAKEEEIKIKKLNKKLLKEVFYFKNEVEKTFSEISCKYLNENKFDYDELNFGSSEELQADQDIMFDDNLHIYNLLLQKRQPVLQQYINKITQPNQLCQLLQDLKGIKESIDVARSLVVLKFIELNDLKIISSMAYLINDKSEIILENEKWLKTSNTNSINIAEKFKYRQVKDEGNDTTQTLEASQNLNDITLSENWFAIEGIDLSNECKRALHFDKRDKPNHFWVPGQCEKLNFSENRVNKVFSEFTENVTEVGFKQDQKNVDLKVFVNQFFEIFLKSKYFDNPGFVANVEDAVNYKKERMPQICRFIDSTKVLSGGYSEDSLSESSVNNQSILLSKSEKQSKPVQLVRPTRHQQRPISHYSSLWLASIARLSLENFLRSGAISSANASLPKGTFLPHKLRLKPKISTQPKPSHEFLPHCQVEAMSSPQRTLRLNLLSPHDPYSSKKTYDPNRQLLRGIDLGKYCSRPCKLLLVNRYTSPPESPRTDSPSSLFVSSSLRWIIKLTKKPIGAQLKRVHCAEKSFVSPHDLIQLPKADKTITQPNLGCGNNLQFKMVEVEIRDLTQEKVTLDGSCAVKQTVIMKPLNPADIYPGASAQDGNVFVIPSQHTAYHPTSHTNYHSSRLGKIPLKQQRRRHIFRNI